MNLQRLSFRHLISIFCSIILLTFLSVSAYGNPICAQIFIKSITNSTLKYQDFKELISSIRQNSSDTNTGNQIIQNLRTKRNFEESVIAYVLADQSFEGKFILEKIAERLFFLTEPNSAQTSDLVTFAKSDKELQEIRTEFLNAYYSNKASKTWGDYPKIVKRLVAELNKEKSNLRTAFRNSRIFTDEFDQIDKSFLDIEERRRFFIENLKLPGSVNETLTMSWRTFNPSHFTQRDNYVYPYVFDSAVDYSASPYNQNTFAAVHRMFGNIWSPDSNFYESVYKNYHGRLKEEIIAAVQSADHKLERTRGSYGQIFFSKSFGEYTPIGTIRVYEGTQKSISDWMFAPRTTDYLLPWQQMYLERGIQSKAHEEIQKMKKSNPFRQFFEIGKLTLSDGVETSYQGLLNEKAMRIMDFWLYYYYARQFPRAIFYVHVATEAHRKLYQSRYNFKKVETVEVQTETGPVHEYILALSGTEFKASLKQRLFGFK